MDLQGRVRNDADQAYESDVNKVFTQAEVPHANPDPDQVNLSLGTIKAKFYAKVRRQATFKKPLAQRRPGPSSIIDSIWVELQPDSRFTGDKNNQLPDEVCGRRHFTDRLWMD